MGVCYETYLLPPPNHLPIPHKPLPDQSLGLLGRRQQPRLTSGSREQLLGARREAFPLRHKVPAHKAEGALGDEPGADVEVSGVPGAESKRLGREAVRRDPRERRGEDGGFRRAEGTFVRWAVVGVVCPPPRSRASGPAWWEEDGRAGGGWSLEVR